MGCESCKQAQNVLENRTANPTPATAVNFAQTALGGGSNNNNTTNTQSSGQGRRTLNRALNGKRKSLLIGINYVGQQGELRGCINDVRTMKNYIASCGFPSTPDAMKILTEEAGYELPTRANIIRAFHWLVDGSVSGDNLFLHYSGHGGQLSDKNGDESDGKDETLVPLDYQQAGQISDDEIYQLLVQKLPKGVRLTVVFDCCHSGSAMDLPYALMANDSNLAGITNAIGGASGGSSSMPVNATWIAKALQYLAKFFPSLKPILAQFGNLQGLINGLNQMQSLGSMAGLASNFGQMAGFGNQIPGAMKDIPDLFSAVQQKFPEAGQIINDEKDKLADVIMFSGCEDKQTSADVGNTTGVFVLPANVGVGGAGGACTNAMLEILVTNKNLTYQKLLEGMRTKLKQKGFSQIPQLSSTVNIDINKEPFWLIPS